LQVILQACSTSGAQSHATFVLLSCSCCIPYTCCKHHSLHPVPHQGMLMGALAISGQSNSCITSCAVRHNKACCKYCASTAPLTLAPVSKSVRACKACLRCAVCSRASDSCTQRTALSMQSESALTDPERVDMDKSLQDSLALSLCNYAVLTKGSWASCSTSAKKPGYVPRSKQQQMSG